MKQLSAIPLARLALILLAPLILARKTNRDWASMSDADWDKIDESWEDPEDRAEREAQDEKTRKKFDAAKSQNSPAGFDMEAFQRATTDAERQAILNKVKTAKPKKEGQGLALGHVFVTVRGFDGCCGEDRKAVTALGRKWSQLLGSTGMDAAFSVWKDDQVAFETKHEQHVREISEFVLKQPEAALVRHDMEDTYGPAATAEGRAEHEAKVAAREAAKEAKKAAVQAEAAKRKKKEEKKAAKAERIRAKKAKAAEVEEGKSEL